MVFPQIRLFFAKNIIITTKHSISQMAIWHTHKQKLLQMPLEEKRALYKSKDFIGLDDVQTWSEYARSHKNSIKKPTQDDMAVFGKTSINEQMNANLAQKVSIFNGDITKLEIDAIVNAANSRLQAGGGVDGAIHRAAGQFLQDECNTLMGCQTGEAKITGGYNLPAKYIIHTVGPQDGSAQKLKSCYDHCLALCLENNLHKIAFPCISTGVYGFPNRLASHIALGTSREFLEKNPHVDRIIFCTFLPIDKEIYETLMQIYFPLS